MIVVKTPWAETDLMVVNLEKTIICGPFVEWII
jgi:hypothetical protein